MPGQQSDFEAQFFVGTCGAGRLWPSQHQQTSASGGASDGGAKPRAAARSSIGESDESSERSDGERKLAVRRTRSGGKEEAPCSQRGICDGELGICKCFDGNVASDGRGLKGSRGDCGARDVLGVGDLVA